MLRILFTLTFFDECMQIYNIKRTTVSAFLASLDGYTREQMCRTVLRVREGYGICVQTKMYASMIEIMSTSIYDILAIVDGYTREQMCRRTLLKVEQDMAFAQIKMYASTVRDNKYQLYDILVIVKVD
jgi:hypothetical protein